jgi:hypothetical protein
MSLDNNVKAAKIIRNRDLHRVSIKLHPEEIFKRMEKGSKYTRIGCYDVKLKSDRLKLFASKGVICCKCGLVGSRFYMEKHEGSKSYHLNLYAVNKNGNEILMTKDHIIPRSRGGSDKLFNYRTMCFKCNTARKNKLTLKDILFFIGEYIKFHLGKSKPLSTKWVTISFGSNFS